MVGRGGEVLVYRGHFDGRRVAVREVVMSQSDWNLPEGQEIIKVAVNVPSHHQLALI